MPQLSIVVPTFNEAGNVAELRDRVAAALPGWRRAQRSYSSATKASAPA
jgi:hypothetical protein